MKTLIHIFTLLLLMTALPTIFAQKITFKVIDQPDTTVHLVKYQGSKLYYADTAEIKKGIVEFDGSKQKAGLIGLLLPGEKLIEAIYDGKDVDIETSGENYVANMKVKKSDENKLFNEYVRFVSDKRGTAQKIHKQMEEIGDKENDSYKKLESELQAINSEVETFQKEFIAQHSDKLVAQMMRATMDIPLPEPPKDENGNITDSNFVYHYFRDHYFDNIDFSNDALVNTPIFGNKIEFYFSNRMLIQHQDTILKYAYQLIDNKMTPTSKAFEYVVSYVASTFGKSNQMGMDKVYIMMLDKYYCSKNKQGKSPAYWMTEEKLKEACEKVDVQKTLVLGAKAPNIILPDTLDRAWDKLNWINMYKLDAEYTVLYFWEHTCGFCKKITPKLAELYDKKLKDRNIEVYAVGKASGESYKKWKEYIVENNLKFINVAVTETALKKGLEDASQIIPRFTTVESMNVNSTYDIFSTPRIFLLDKDKKIIAKQISVSQLEEMLDRFQGKENEPKLFPEELEEDQHMKEKG